LLGEKEMNSPCPFLSALFILNAIGGIYNIWQGKGLSVMWVVAMILMISALSGQPLAALFGVYPKSPEQEDKKDKGT
jgi:hypothetical protein